MSRTSKLVTGLPLAIVYAVLVASFVFLKLFILGFYFSFFFLIRALSPYFIILQQREDRIYRLLKTRAFITFFCCLHDSGDGANRLCRGGRAGSRAEKSEDGKRLPF